MASAHGLCEHPAKQHGIFRAFQEKSRFHPGLRHAHAAARAWGTASAMSWGVLPRMGKEGAMRIPARACVHTAIAAASTASLCCARRAAAIPESTSPEPATASWGTRHGEMTEASPRLPISVPSPLRTHMEGQSPVRRSKAPVRSAWTSRDELPSSAAASPGWGVRISPA